MNPQQLTQLKAELKDYPQNSKPQFPLGQRRQLVASLLDEIESLRQKDYSFGDISDLLGAKTALSFKPNTLRKYFFEERNKRKERVLDPLDPPTEPVGRKKSSKAKPASKTGSSKAKPGKSQASGTSTPMPLTATPEDEGPSITAALEPQPEIQPSQSLQPSDVGDWDDSNPPAGGLLNEPRFNVIERD